MSGMKIKISKTVPGWINNEITNAWRGARIVENSWGGIMEIGLLLLLVASCLHIYHRLACKTSYWVLLLYCSPPHSCLIHEHEHHETIELT